MRVLSNELDVQMVFGCPIMQLVENDSNRKRILDERSLTLQRLVEKIQTTKSQMRRKEELLMKYSEEMKKLRQMEGEKRTRDAYVEKLERDLQNCRDENCRLRESLTVSRDLCARDERKKKNTFSMDCSNPLKPQGQGGKITKK